uniref:Transmembrane protein n=1 Tax=Solanum lycopersicum TaxID=4081 RepID=A0A3Q7J777_SOLLC
MLLLLSSSNSRGVVGGQRSEKAEELDIVRSIFSVIFACVSWTFVDVARWSMLLVVVTILLTVWRKCWCCFSLDRNGTGGAISVLLLLLVECCLIT